MGVVDFIDVAADSVVVMITREGSQNRVQPVKDAWLRDSLGSGVGVAVDGGEGERLGGVGRECDRQ